MYKKEEMAKKWKKSYGIYHRVWNTSRSMGSGGGINWLQM
jgi:hypothetical protein